MPKRSISDARAEFYGGGTAAELLKLDDAIIAGKSFSSLMALTDPTSPYTSSYGPVSQTLPNYASDSENVAYTGLTSLATGVVFAQVVDLNSLRVAYENLRVSYDALLKFCNSLVIDLKEKEILS